MKETGYRQINKSLNICAFEDYLKSQQAKLLRLPDVEQVSPRVIRVLGQNPGKFTLQGTNTFIVGTGFHRAIVDTGQGVPEWKDLIASTLKKYGFTFSHVLLTHWHGDHTLGVPQLLELYPELSDSIYKNSPGSGQQPIVDGQIFKVEGATIRAVHAPGHSEDHMCFILEEENAMFTGDNILGNKASSAVEDLGTYMETLQKMIDQGCQIGYPAHGPVIGNLDAKLKGELTMKRRREGQVVKSLQAAKSKGPIAAGRIPSLTLKELVTAIHGDSMDEEVRAMALEPFINEVCRKLAEDGRVAFQLHGGERRWFSIE
ncbi:hypothetical protein LQW54_000663 [Pestalotiopsis sp. IQ-011]